MSHLIFNCLSFFFKDHTYLDSSVIFAYKGVGEGFLVVSEPLLECCGRVADVNFCLAAVSFGGTYFVDDAFLIYEAFTFMRTKVRISAGAHLFVWCWWHCFLSYDFFIVLVLLFYYRGLNAAITICLMSQ